MTNIKSPNEPAAPQNTTGDIVSINEPPGSNVAPTPQPEGKPAPAAPKHEPPKRDEDHSTHRRR